MPGIIWVAEFQEGRPVMAWIETRERRKRAPKHGPPPKAYKVFKVYWRDPTGRIRTRTFDRKVDAQRHARDIEGRKDRGEYVDPEAGQATLADTFEHFMSTATYLRPTTRAKYEVLGRLYLVGEGLNRIESIGDWPIRAIGRREVSEFLTGLATMEGKGAATVEAVARLLHRVLEIAVEEDEIRRNPAHGVSVAASRRREPRFLTEKEVAAIAAKMDERYRALVWTLALGGLRIGEASALRVRNLDVKAGTIRVVESSAEVGGRKVTGPTKSGKERTVDLPSVLRRMLTEHLKRFGNPFDPDSYVFTGPDGGQIRQNAFRSRIFQPAAETAKITPVPTVHDLRHTAASFYARAGLTLLEAAGQLGHGATTMTERYSHVFKEHRQAKIKPMGNLIDQR
jgi:integrase